MIPRIPVVVSDGAGKPYMLRVEQTRLTPEGTVAYMNKAIKEIGFGMIQFRLASEDEFAAWSRGQSVERLRVEQE